MRAGGHHRRRTLPRVSRVWCCAACVGCAVSDAQSACAVSCLTVERWRRTSCPLMLYHHHHHRLAHSSPPLLMLPSPPPPPPPVIDCRREYSPSNLEVFFRSNVCKAIDASEAWTREAEGGLCLDGARHCAVNAVACVHLAQLHRSPHYCCPCTCIPATTPLSLRMYLSCLTSHRSCPLRSSFVCCPRSPRARGIVENQQNDSRAARCAVVAAAGAAGARDGRHSCVLRGAKVSAVQYGSSMPHLNLVSRECRTAMSLESLLSVPYHKCLLMSPSACTSPGPNSVAQVQQGVRRNEGQGWRQLRQPAGAGQHEHGRALTDDQ